MTWDEGVGGGGWGPLRCRHLNTKHDLDQCWQSSGIIDIMKTCGYLVISKCCVLCVNSMSLVKVGVSKGSVGCWVWLRV